MGNRAAQENMSIGNRTKESLFKEIEKLESQLKKTKEEAKELRQASAEALKENKACLFTIVESAMDAILSVDSQQNIIVFNRAAEMMFRCSAYPGSPVGVASQRG